MGTGGIFAHEIALINYLKIHVLYVQSSMRNVLTMVPKLAYVVWENTGELLAYVYLF